MSEQEQQSRAGLGILARLKGEPLSPSPSMWGYADHRINRVWRFGKHGRISIRATWAKAGNFMGRFGGGWQWKLGVQASETLRSWIFGLLVMQIIIDVRPVEQAREAEEQRRKREQESEAERKQRDAEALEAWGNAMKRSGEVHKELAEQ